MPGRSAVVDFGIHHVRRVYARDHRQRVAQQEVRQTVRRLCRGSVALRITGRERITCRQVADRVADRNRINILAVTAAQNRSTAAKRRCVREADARQEVRIAAGDAARRQTALLHGFELHAEIAEIGEERVGGEPVLHVVVERAGQRQRIVLDVEGDHVIVGGARRVMRFPTKSKVQSKARGHAPVVLEIGVVLHAGNRY